MTNIQLYTQPIENYYSEQQIAELGKSLDPRLVKTRQEGGQTLEYIQGHTAIDQANRILGYGNWGSRVLECTLQNIIDPISGEGIGAIYLARVEVWVWVHGTREAVVDVGSQPVAVSSVEEQIMGRRINDAKKYRKPVDESPFTLLEKKNARAVIVKAHEQAQKGAATDGLKRALRLLGNQFGNALYGDGQVDLSPVDGSMVEADNGSMPAKPAQPKRVVDASTPKNEKPALPDDIRDGLNRLFPEAKMLKLFTLGRTDNESLMNFFRLLSDLVSENVPITKSEQVTVKHLDALEKHIAQIKEAGAVRLEA